MANDVTFCLIVPSGTWDLRPLVEAIGQHHPDSSVVAVWCGDPHLRPVLERALAVAWIDLDLAPPSVVGWGSLLAALSPRAYEWTRAATACRRRLDERDGDIIVLRVGSVAVLGRSTALVGTDSLTVVARQLPSLAADGCSPAPADFVREGSSSTVLLGLRDGAQPALEWLAANVGEADRHVGPWLDLMAALFSAGTCGDPAVGIGAWTAEMSVPPAVLDLEHFDATDPWWFSVGDRPARNRLSSNVVLRDAIAAAMPQIAGSHRDVCLPGGVEIDAAIRSTLGPLVRPSAPSAPFAPAGPPEPFGPDHSEFTAWLASAPEGGPPIGRYWSALIGVRSDLSSVFPRHVSTDMGRYREWIDGSWRHDDRSVLLTAGQPEIARVTSIDHDSAGINVVGYLAFDQSLGFVARQIADALDASGTPVSLINHERAMLSPAIDHGRFANDAHYGTNLVVVTADQFEFVVADHPQLLEGRRTIGYWFWELEDVPARFESAIDHVDEIWTGSQFIADAFARVTDKPVRCVSLPIAEPQPSERTRATMHVPDDAYVFLTTFDQFSVPERKNPFGSIDAFTRAFAEGEGPVLLIKTLNGSKGWRNHERLLLAASGRSDIVVWDEHLSRADQMAVLNAADCLVSLHRSEGLGLHCAEAMWLGKPVIATNYSGNVDFMDGSVAAMIDYDLIHVRHGEGIYPVTAKWADPDVDQAADWMRRLVADPALGATMGAAARRRMQQQPSLADAGRRMAELAGIDRSSTDEAHEGAPR